MCFGPYFATVELVLLLPLLLSWLQTGSLTTSLRHSSASASQIATTAPPADPLAPIDISTATVAAALQHLRDSVTRPDGVPAVAFKHLQDILATPLAACLHSTSITVFPSHFVVGRSSCYPRPRS